MWKRGLFPMALDCWSPGDPTSHVGFMAPTERLVKSPFFSLLTHNEGINNESSECAQILDDTYRKPHTNCQCTKRNPSIEQEKWNYIPDNDVVKQKTSPAKCWINIKVWLIRVALDKQLGNQAPMRQPYPPPATRRKTIVCRTRIGIGSEGDLSGGYN